MKEWLCSKIGGLGGFLLIAALVAGGLGWATAAALSLERERLAQQAATERANPLRLALWRLDSRIAPLLAREDSRPFNHYSAIYAPPLAFDRQALLCDPGTVLEPSPLLNAELPAWMLLHFQTDADSGWESPQVLSPTLTNPLATKAIQVPLTNVTPQRRQLLQALARDLPPAALLDVAREHTAPTTLRDTTLLMARKGAENTIKVADNNYQEAQGQQPAPASPKQTSEDFMNRSVQQSKLRNEARNPQPRYDLDAAITNFTKNGEAWITATPQKRARSTEVPVNLSPMVPLWLRAENGTEYLVVLRLVRVAEKEVCQGIVLGAPQLAEFLAGEVQDLFPNPRLTPVYDPDPSDYDRTMAALPFQLDVGDPGPVPDPGWTPLRVGLTLAWAAALMALLAVGLGGWSLLDLSERRIRFVSAVTHELRTPLTTLRLYLDMLLNGFVHDQGQREEYLQTLQAEADRLNRLVGNVLDFSRLEKQRPRLDWREVAVADLLAQLAATWQGRCHDASKELIFENSLGEKATVWTDGGLVQQVLGNLIDNACKYSRDSEDRRLWVRARAEGSRVVFEVEDRGPGVPACDRYAIFRPFRRGRGADVTAGGVGLGLALAQRWTRLLGGRLTLQNTPAAGGACFRLELPMQAGSTPKP
jgi:signal transduction histidine kinase